MEGREIDRVVSIGKVVWREEEEEESLWGPKSRLH
jgi:hypothetical protein